MDGKNDMLELDPIQLGSLIGIGIVNALAVQKEFFEQQLSILQERFNELKVRPPTIEEYKQIEIIAGKECDESLDIVTSLPDFDGKQGSYGWWRKAAHIAYKVFENYQGSSRHFQAVAIIRNKVIGPASMLLASYNTVLNFKAIIARLDFKYAGQRPTYLIEHDTIPSYEGEMLHIDIFNIAKNYFLICVDHFSKFAVVQSIRSPTIIDVSHHIMQLINFFPTVKTMYCNNHPSLNSKTILSIMKNQFNVNVVIAPPLLSGQIERLRTTIKEIARCIKQEKQIQDVVDLILIATIEYNKSTHSVTKKKPVEIFRANSPELRDHVISLLEKEQQQKINT